MWHEARQTAALATPAELRKFGLFAAGFIALVFGLALPWLVDGSFPLWPWIGALVLKAAALLQPASLKPVYTVMLLVGHVLGWVNSRILLTIVFYGLILPTGLVRRMLGKDPMARRGDDHTYRIPSEPLADDHMERPY
jgi:hypothetical protein